MATLVSICRTTSTFILISRECDEADGEGWVVAVPRGSCQQQYDGVMIK